MGFRVGDLVEVCSREDGFLGSYFLAKIVSNNSNTTFEVEYKTLVADDEKTPLIETVMTCELRQVPPELKVSSFKLLDRVDAFDLDGWWVGRITGKKSSGIYYVYFDSSGDEYEYPFSCLRVHMEFQGARWTVSRKMGV